MAATPVIRLHSDDSVVIARTALLPGAEVAQGVAATERIPAGHKVAVKPIAVGEPVMRYGQIIGFATVPIAPGQHVHVQNIGMGEFSKDYAYGVDVKPTPNFDLPATFQGIRRSDGRVATRNYIGILTSVNCSAHVAGLVADVFKKNPFTGHDPLAAFPNVDGVVALTHKTGCGMTQLEPLTVLRRTLGGYARHVNFSHVIILGLGCEMNQIGGFLEEQRLAGRLRSLDIQDVGGSGLALMCELLGGALTGNGATKTDRRFSNGMLAIFIDPKVVDPAHFFDGEVARYIAYFKDSKLAQGHDAVLIPGEPEAATRAERTKNGVPLTDETWNSITATARSVGIDDAAVAKATG